MSKNNPQKFKEKQFWKEGGVVFIELGALLQEKNAAMLLGLLDLWVSEMKVGSMLASNT